MDLLQIQKESYQLLEKSGKQKYIFAVFLQVSLGLFDILGIVLAGMIGMLATSSITKAPISPWLMKILDFLGLSQTNPSTVVIILCLTALLFFLLKSILALTFSKRAFRFLGNHQNRVTSLLVAKVLDADYIWLRQQEPHALSTALILGVSAATVNSLGQFMLLISEFSLIVLFMAILVVVNPLVALFTVLYLIIVVAVLKQLVGRKVSQYNQNLGKIQVESQVTFYGVLKLFREIRVFRRTSWFKDRLDALSTKRAQNFSDDMWLQQVPKYTLEVAMLLGAAGLLLAGKSFTSSGQVATILAIYLTAASRLFPSLLRIQSSIFSLQSRQHYSTLALELFKELQNLSDTKAIPIQDSHQVLNNLYSRPLSASDETRKKASGTTMQLEKVSFTFPRSEVEVLKSLSFQISLGERVAVVGPSGAGKSTLCDIFLGLLMPNSGSATIDGEPAAEWVNKNPGKVAYLPQEVTLIDGTLLENVCLGLEKSDIDARALARAFERAQLSDFLEGLPDGLETIFGAGGMTASGGQKQRIGLARALYMEPNILIMDEATSALDAQTEFDVMSAIEQLGSNTTVIMIAHRLSSIREFPRILYLEDGKLLGDGNLHSLRHVNPKFDSQLKLSGI